MQGWKLRGERDENLHSNHNINIFPLKAIRSLSFLIVIKLCNPLLTQSHGDADSKVVQSH